MGFLRHFVIKSDGREPIRSTSLFGSRKTSGGFLSGDFHLSRRDRVMFRFFGQLRNAEQPKMESSAQGTVVDGAERK